MAEKITKKKGSKGHKMTFNAKEKMQKPKFSLFKKKAMTEESMM